jgi:uncharacterized protein (TIGR02246 family)
MIRFAFSAVPVIAILALAGCSHQQKVDIAAEEATIRSTDGNWLSAATAHDLERTVSFWSDDAVILAPGGPPIRGKQAIHKYVTNAFATPGFSITWKTDQVEISKSGDLAYATGTDSISVTGPHGKPDTVENNSLAIWKKQPDGSWKCIVDVMTPAAAPPAVTP